MCKFRSCVICTRKYASKKELKHFFWKKKKKDNGSQKLAKRLLFFSFYAIIEEFLVLYPFLMTFSCLWLSIFVDIAVLLVKGGET